MAKSASSKIRKKESNFENLFFTICATNNTSQIPSLKVLSSPPKFGEKWKTYIFHEDPEIKYFDVYVQYENYLKDGNIKKVIFRNQKVDENILNCLEESLQTYKTITSLKFYNCQLTEPEVKVLSKILNKYENIIDLSFDRNPLATQDFFLLLKDNNLKYLSLQLCKVDEYGIETISEELKANNTLIFLDLSCNLICDDGLIYLCGAIRQNRCLVSIILMDNMITDEGIEHLMRALNYFELNAEEIAIRRQIRFKFELAKLKGGSLASGSIVSKRTAKDKSITSSIERRLDSRRASQKSGSKKSSGISTNTYVNAEYHPFVDDSVPDNGGIYCKGNYKVTYINLAYNKITEKGFKFIEDTIRYQINMFSGPSQGLVDLILTGNRALPDYYQEIQKLLDYKKTAEREIERRSTLKNSL